MATNSAEHRHAMLQAKHESWKHECRDIVADEITGVQIGTRGHKLWICVDGICVLRIKSPEIEFTDLRIDPDTDP